MSYEWSFGDGGSATTATPTTIAYSYRAVGSYTVTLRVTDTAGQSATVSQPVRVRRL